MQPTDEDILHCNPWEMDDTDYRVLRNAMVVTRKPSACAICLEDIPVGARVRSQSGIFDGHAKTFKFCVKCCHHMGRLTAGLDRDGRGLSHRYDLGRNRKEGTLAT